MPFRNVPFLLPTSEMKYWRLSLSNSTLHWTYCCNDRREIISSHHIFPLREEKMLNHCINAKISKAWAPLLESLLHRYITVGQKCQEQNKISHLVIKLIHVFSTPYWLQHLVFSTHVKLSFLCKRTIKSQSESLRHDSTSKIEKTHWSLTIGRWTGFRDHFYAKY